MKRLSMCILFLGLATMSCTLPDVPEGECGNDAKLGDRDCQCVTSDTDYSKASRGWKDDTLLDLSYCSNRQKDYYIDLDDTSEIYVCIQHQCHKAKCEKGTIPDDRNMKCIKQCAPNEIHEDDNTCICDTEKNWEGEAGACRCKLGYVEVSGACVKSLEDTCDLIKELYDASTNTCVCDTKKHFEGKVGSCTCKTGYVLINGACAVKQTCREDQVYVEADNTCDCPTDYEELDGRKCVHTGTCTGANQVYDIDKDACVCAEGYLWFGDACIAKAECTGSSKRMISHSDVGTCTCFFEYTYIYNDCYQAGDTLTFGRYPQDEDSDTPSPLTWRILEINDDAALLISEYVLEQYRYHDEQEDITWEKSNVRSYLNGFSAAFNKNGIDHYDKGFIDKAFTADERKWIKQVTNKNPDAPTSWNSTPGGNDTEDKVFLLSRDEALKHFKTHKSRIASPTAYALHPPTNSGSMNLYTCPVTCSSDNSCACSEGTTIHNDIANVHKCSNVQCGSRWWLRSPGNKPNVAARVHVNGDLLNYYVDRDHLGLRPALYVRLSSEG